MKMSIGNTSTLGLKVCEWMEAFGFLGQWKDVTSHMLPNIMPELKEMMIKDMKKKIRKKRVLYK